MINNSHSIVHDAQRHFIALDVTFIILFTVKKNETRQASDTEVQKRELLSNHFN
jgi:hypothetical protein